jgi:hypothetical protein
VPVEQTIVFGCEVRVEATSLKEAKKLAVSPSAEVPDGLDWDRSTVVSAKIGDWQEIEIEEDV